jgi:hypothetical protein
VNAKLLLSTFFVIAVPDVAGTQPPVVSVAPDVEPIAMKFDVPAVNDGVTDPVDSAVIVAAVGLVMNGALS